MSGLVVTFVLVSAVMHAVWNLMVRGRGDKQTTVYRMLLIIVAGGLVPSVISEVLAQSMTPTLWLIAGGAGIANGLYYICLAKSLAASSAPVSWLAVSRRPFWSVAAICRPSMSMRTPKSAPICVNATESDLRLSTPSPDTMGTSSPPAS